MKYNFSLFTINVTIAALILGNLVVATNSGDACGTDWPFCNGQVIPDITDYHVVIEYSHRLFTTLLGLVILVNAIIAWKKSTGKAVKVIAVLSTILLLIQAMIGGMNVLLGTPTGFTTLDVMFSLFLLISLIFLHAGLNKRAENIKLIEIKKPLMVGFSVLMTEVLVGAIFKHFELSQQIFEVSNTGIQLATFIYFIHGILGLITLFYTGYAVFLALRFNVMKTSALLLILLASLTTFGGFIVKTEELSPISSSVHMILSILTVALLSHMTAICYFNQKNKN
ncbi:COX15/CtaA family protein [Rossellomorea aquimaris]|uniref:Cytochrome c oxidase assembly protein subunit 15 n=1 Tax=Rossellomorea aquimaris TaxID=189382 RepID=A0A366ET36_9BACI|nr:COX15/CtaA family protein [Rossellomorea aquimaris]RBP05558.1 cytochrome c oxidase assembly protein subunit 15 [Rossellomorea aquimaris]